jgi:hypothetical protein
LEEFEKSKGQSQTSHAQLKDQYEVLNRTNQDLLRDLKVAQKQKNDLLLGFKKQNQLIEVLKRQKV